MIKGHLSFKNFMSQRATWYILSYHLFVCLLSLYLPEKELPNKVENLDAAEDGEASEEPHRAANET